MLSGANNILSRTPRPQFTMITRFITEVSTAFNPFSPKAKTARLFLSFLPPNARQSMKINTKLLPRTSRIPSSVDLKFSKGLSVLSARGAYLTNWTIEDGKEMKLDPEKLGIKGVIEEVDRHSRILSRQEELTGNWIKRGLPVVHHCIWAASRRMYKHIHLLGGAAIFRTLFRQLYLNYSHRESKVP